MFFNQTVRIMNLYIESIEGGNFIAGVGEEQVDTLLSDNYTGTNSFQSLSALKEQLAGRTFNKVWLKQNTPYDEMCGSHDDNQRLMLELNWR